MIFENPQLLPRLACLEIRGGNERTTHSTELPGLVGWVACKPLDAAPRGGDLYYMSSCNIGIMSRIVLADVAGHGEVVSAPADRLRTALRNHVERWDQSLLVQELNESFFQNEQGEVSATAFIASLYADTGKLLFTNAGHPPPLWFHAATGQWTLLDRDSAPREYISDLPLGMIEGTAYTQTAVRLEPSDLLLLYTDGISESRNESGEELGIRGLRRMAEGFSIQSAEDAGKSLLAEVARYRGGAPSNDDESVIALFRS